MGLTTKQKLIFKVSNKKKLLHSLTGEPLESISNPPFLSSRSMYWDIREGLDILEN